MGADGGRQGAGFADRGGRQRGTREPQLLGHCHGGGLAVAKGRGEEMDGQVKAGIGVDLRRIKGIRGGGRILGSKWVI